jgi:glycosyltransferase involved in cell wall biosynthesis
MNDDRPNRKIVVIAGLDISLLNFRGPLLISMLRAGYEVVALAPPQNPEIHARLASLGIRFIGLPIARAGLNPYRDWTTRRALKEILSRENPRVLLAYTIKPVVLGISAGKAAGIPARYALITGLGAAFNSLGITGLLLRAVARILYRRTLRHCTRVIVQNRDIERFLYANNLVPKTVPVVVVPGSGVDTDYFAASNVPPGPPIFLLLARMLRDKGIHEFVEAARTLKKDYPLARFVLVGDTDPNPSAIPRDQLHAWSQEGVVEYQPSVSDVRPFLMACTAYVLPSYHEGMPRSVLEAMSMGRPVITTDAVGCRETVLDPVINKGDSLQVGRNGLLVPPRDKNSLARAMAWIINNPDRATQMGQEGRLISEQLFAVERINRLMFEAMDLSAAPLVSFANQVETANSY